MQIRDVADMTVHILLGHGCSSLFEQEPLIHI